MFILLFSFLDSWRLNMGSICRPETSVRNYLYSLRNDPEERNSPLLRGGILKSRILASLVIEPSFKWVLCVLFFETLISGGLHNVLNTCVAKCEHIRKTPLQIQFIYSSDKEIYWIFKTCCVSSVLCATKCRLFHYIILFSIFTFLLSMCCHLNIHPAQLNVKYCGLVAVRNNTSND